MSVLFCKDRIIRIIIRIRIRIIIRIIRSGIINRSVVSYIKAKPLERQNKAKQTNRKHARNERIVMSFLK